jgi:hypothetical protein
LVFAKVVFINLNLILLLIQILACFHIPYLQRVALLQCHQKGRIKVFSGNNLIISVSVSTYLDFNVLGMEERNDLDFVEVNEEGETVCQDIPVDLLLVRVETLENLDLRVVTLYEVLDVLNSVEVDVALVFGLIEPS